MGDKQGLKEAIEKIQPQQSTKDGKYYYTREELIKLTYAIEDNGYWNQVEDAKWGVYMDSDNFFARNLRGLNPLADNNFYDFGQDPDMLRVTKLYNELADDENTLRNAYRANKSVWGGKLFDREYENIMQDAEGFYNINVYRSVQRLAKEEIRDSVVNQVMSADGALAGPGDAVNRILTAYEAAYDGITENSKVHHIFCCYDKDGRDNGEWSWKKDDLEQVSPMYKYYQSLSKEEQKYFEEGMQQLQELSNTRSKDLLLGYVRSTNKTMKELIDEGNSRDSRFSSKEHNNNDPENKRDEEIAMASSKTQEKKAAEKTNLKDEKDEFTADASEKPAYVKTEAGVKLQEKLSEIKKIKIDGMVGPETSLACINCGLGKDLSKMFGRPLEEIERNAKAGNHSYFINLNNKEGYRDKSEDDVIEMIASLDININQYRNLAYNGQQRVASLEIG